MKKILVVGCGKWGKILIKKLRLISKINSVLNSKVNYRSINTKDVDWVFILTPDKLHYGMVKFCGCLYYLLSYTFFLKNLV